MKLRTWLTAVGIALLSSGVSWASSVAFVVTVDTRAIPLQSGLIDFQFNPGPTDPVQAANVTVAYYTGDTLGTVELLTGDVLGTLGGPNVLFIDNGVVAGSVTSWLNEYAQDVTYTTFMNFRLIFDGDALNIPDSTSASPSTFALTMLSFDSGSLVPVTGADGIVLTIDVGWGSATVTSKADFVDIFVVPEPGTLPTVAAALAALLLLTFGTRPSKLIPICKAIRKSSQR